MNGSDQLDWGLIRTFLAVAEEGSVSAAARKLGSSQPTVSRQINQLEECLNVGLFERSIHGSGLTGISTELLASAVRAHRAIEEFERKARGADEELHGDVRVSVNEVVGYYMLPPAIADFQKNNPHIDIEIIVSNRATSLNKRDADVALRLFRPTQPDIIAKKLANLPLGLFAHNSYLEQHGAPKNRKELKEKNLIGFDQDIFFLNATENLGWGLEAKDFSLRTDSLLTQISLIRSAAGIGISHAGIMNAFPDVSQVLKSLSIPSLELWMVYHKDLKLNRRVIKLIDFLSLWFVENPYQKIHI